MAHPGGRPIELLSDWFPFESQQQELDYLKKENKFLLAGINNQRELIEIYQRKLGELNGNR